MEYLTEEDYQRAAENGISRRLAYQRFYNQGMSRERAINEPPRKKRSVDPYRMYKAKCDAVGISETTFYRRLKKGMTPEEACSFPPDHSGRFRSYPNAKLQQKHYEIAKKNGIGRGTLQGRVYMYKWTVADAMTLPIGTKRKAVIV